MIRASVIIATFNRAARLRACLEALAVQTTPPEEFEVIVVVDGSTDETVKTLSSLHLPYLLHVIEQPNSGQCAALDRGVSTAVSGTCIFLDDDIVAGPNLVAEHLQLQREHENVVGIGQLILQLAPGADWFARSFAEEWQQHYQLLNNGERTPTFQDCYGGNLSVKRSVFLKVGGFDASLARAYDIDLGYRLSVEGQSFVYLLHATGAQVQQKGFRELTADSRQSGAACVDLYRRYPPTLLPLLGTFAEQRPRMALILRALLTVNFPFERLWKLCTILRLPTGDRVAYQIVQRYCFWRGVREVLGDPDRWNSLTGGIPILMYHAFTSGEEPATRFVIPINRFSQQMAWLARTGYRVLRLEELLDSRRESRLPPSRSVVITIDDGYADSWTLAYPVLRQYDFPATVFLVSDCIGQANSWADHGPLSGRALLSWPDIHRMREGGTNFGSHTRTHPDLTRIPAELVRDEIQGSRAHLEKELGTSIRTFSYPFGRFSPQTESEAEQAGYLGSCSVNAGLNTCATPPHSLRRVEIFGTDTLLQFALAVRFGARVPLILERAKQLLQNGSSRGERDSSTKASTQRAPAGHLASRNEISERTRGR